MAIKVHDPITFMKKYPKLTKHVPAQEAHTAPDLRKIKQLLDLGGTVDGITVTKGREKEEEEDENPTGAAPGSMTSTSSQSASVAAPTGSAAASPKVHPVIAAADVAGQNAQAATSTADELVEHPAVSEDQRPTFMRKAEESMYPYLVGRPKQPGEENRDWHTRARLEWEAEQATKKK